MKGPFLPTKVPLSADAHATRELLKYVPQLSIAERYRRWDRLRKKMIMSGLDARIFLGNDIFWGMGMANMRYVLQIDSQIGADAVFPLAGEPVVWNCVPHMKRPGSFVRRERFRAKSWMRCERWRARQFRTPPCMPK